MATLLYVDDNSQRLLALQTRLELQGYRVLTASNGADALDIFSLEQVDLAILDYYMHGLGGDIVALEMKKARPHVPVIIFSGAFTLPEMVIAFVDAFVFTGDGPDRLIDKIAEFVPRPEQVREGNSGQESTKGAA